MFDFANSSYTTVIITVVFGPIFVELIVPHSEGENPYWFGNMLWALSLASAYAVAGISGPILGTISDIQPKKKKFLFHSYSICILSTASLWFVSSHSLFYVAFIAILISCAAFSLGENFVSSFLPFLGNTKKEITKLSGYAWAVGYFGGLLSIVIVRFIVGESTPENFERLRWIGPLTALFFLISGIPTFWFLQEPKINEQVRQGRVSYLKLAYSKVRESIAELKQFKDLAIFFVSLFFALSSLYIVISFTFIYGKQVIGLSYSQEAVAFVSTQIFAAIGAFSFGWVQSYWKVINTFLLILVLWLISVVFIFFLEEIRIGLHTWFKLDFSPQSLFIIFACFAGLGLGSMQSASRSIVALFSPKQRAGEFFGLWGLIAKLAAILGLVSIAWLQSIFGLHYAFLVLGFFFLLSILVCLFIREDRAIATAKKASLGNG